MKKTVIIIGGSGLIGTAVIKRFIKDYKVINLDISNLKIKDKNYCYEKFDITKKETLEITVKKLFQKYNNVNSVVNCSYPYSNDWKKCNFEEINYKRLNQNLISHLHSYIWSSCIFLRMLKKKGGRSSLTLLSSIYGHRGQDLSIYKKTSIKENLVYTVSKGGIDSFIKSSAAYYGKYNIRVNSVAPGGVKTNKNQKIKIVQETTFLKNYLRRVPLKRMANPEDVANAVFFLSSKDASYITGTNLFVDGGWTSI